MTPPDAKTIIEILAIIMSAAGLCGLLFHRWQTNRSIGARAIQFATVVLLIPAILILSLEDKLNPQSLGTLLGAIAGFLLSGLGSRDPAEEPAKSLE